MGRQRRKFTPEYKVEAVKLVINTGRPIAVVARELGINEATLGRWVNAYKASQDTTREALSESERAELARLRKEIAELKLDRAFLKNRPSSSPRKPRIRTPSVRSDARGKSNHDVTRIARLLGVSPSGFYAWIKRGPSKRALRAERIEAKVEWFHSESDEVSGAPRILADLREDGETISRKTAAKTMRRLGLRGVCQKRWKTTTIHDCADSYSEDVVKREWDTGTLNAVWVGDISCLRTWEGWLYLATVIDGHSRRVIGWAIDEHMRTDLVEEALQMAIALRGELPAKVAFHSDRGTQGGFNTPQRS